jgi:hypothetical protein
MERNRSCLPAFVVLLACLVFVACPTRMQPPELSSDAGLAALTVRLQDQTDVMLDPAFSPGHTSYSSTVSHDVQSVTVVAEPGHEQASVAIEGAPSPAGVTLAQGVTSIGVVVTAEDGTTRTYTVTVEREEPPPAGIIGPEWPSPANPTYAFDVGVDSQTQAGRTGGLNITYSDLDLEAVAELWWALDPTHAPQLSFSGEDALPDGTLAFAAAESTAGASVWVGEIPLTHVVGGSQRTDRVPVRLTIEPENGSFIAASELLAVDDSFDTSIGQLYPVSGDFVLNFLYEANWGSSWRPAYDFYDEMNTPLAAELACAHSFNGVFYYTANE